MIDKEKMDMRVLIACELIGRAVLAIRAGGQVIDETAIQNWLTAEQQRNHTEDVRQPCFDYAVKLLSDEVKLT